jgi:hypothetical protein
LDNHAEDQLGFLPPQSILGRIFGCKFDLTPQTHNTSAVGTQRFPHLFNCGSISTDKPHDGYDNDTFPRGIIHAVAHGWEGEEREHEITLSPKHQLNSVPSQSESEKFNEQSGEERENEITLASPKHPSVSSQSESDKFNEQTGLELTLEDVLHSKTCL